MSDFWVKYLDNPTLSVLPHDYLKPANNKSVESSLSFSIADKVSDFTTGLAVFAALVYRLTGDEDIVISTDESSGSREFIIRLNLTPELKFSELADKVRKEFENNVKQIDYQTLTEVSENIRIAKSWKTTLAFSKYRTNTQILMSS